MAILQERLNMQLEFNTSIKKILLGIQSVSITIHSNIA